MGIALRYLGEHLEQVQALAAALELERDGWRHRAGALDVKLADATARLVAAEEAGRELSKEAARYRERSERLDRLNAELNHDRECLAAEYAQRLEMQAGIIGELQARNDTQAATIGELLEDVKALRSHRPQPAAIEEVRVRYRTPGGDVAEHHLIAAAQATTA